MHVLLLDDHALVLTALSQMLRSLRPALRISACRCPDEAFTVLAGDVPVDLALLDLNLGEQVDGFAVLARMREAHPATPVVVVSGSERMVDLVHAVDLGAMGFVPKRGSNAELRQALACVLAGGVAIPPGLTPQMLPAHALPPDFATPLGAALARLEAERGDVPAGGGPRVAAGGGTASNGADDAGEGADRPRVAEPGPASAAGGAPATAPWGARRADALDLLGLTPRQTEVLSLLLRGLPNKLIARELGVSVETVKDHVAAVLRALGVGSRTQAVLAVGQRMAVLLAPGGGLAVPDAPAPRRPAGVPPPTAERSGLATPRSAAR